MSILSGLPSNNVAAGLQRITPGQNHFFEVLSIVSIVSGGYRVYGHPSPPSRGIEGTFPLEEEFKINTTTSYINATICYYTCLTTCCRAASYLLDFELLPLPSRHGL